MNSSAVIWPVTSSAAFVDETELAFALNSASNHSTLSVAVEISSAIVCEISGRSAGSSAMKPVI